MADEIKSEMDNTQPVTETVTETSDAKVPAMDTAAEMEQIKAALKKANAEAAKYRKAAEAAEAERKAKEEAEMTELQRAQKRAAELEQQLAAKELADRKRTIAEKVGIPPALAARLQGASDEELEQDAKALLESLPKATEKKPSTLIPTNPANAQVGETHEQIKARIFGSTKDIFDPEFSRQHGGGVFFTDKE